MTNHNSPTFIKKLAWHDIRNEVRHVAPELAAIIDRINPQKTLNFIKVWYPFGSRIVSNGTLRFVTNQGNEKPITDPYIHIDIKNLLNYSLVPLGVVVRNAVEVYQELDSRVFSIATWKTGLDIGIWEHFGWTTPYSVTAGARSIYMVPRITLVSAHKRLKKNYGVALPPPKKVSDHWALFKQIATSPNFSDPWTCDVIFFTKSWIEKLHKYKNKANSPWNQLYYYIVSKNIQHSFYGRRRSIFEMVWELFLRTLNRKGLRPNPYVIDTLKHLVFVGTGGSPGSAPATGSHDLGPISALQSAYVDSYGLKDYVPTIMLPRYFDIDNPTPVYYSLQSPTLLESVPKSRNLTTIVDNVRELMEISDHFLDEAFDEHLKIANVSVNDIISRLQFEFFHGEIHAYGKEIRASHEMPEKDPNLLYMPSPLENRKFADTSAYLHGCVRIAAKLQDR